MTSSIDAFEWNKKANRLMRKGELEEAFDAYKRAIEYDPDFIEAWGNLGCLFAQVSRFQDADRCFKMAFEIDQDYVWTLNAYASVLIAQEGRFEEAEQHLIRASQLEPDNPMTWRTMGMLYMDRDSKRAEEAFRHSMEIDPDDRNTLHFFGHLLIEMNQFEEAEYMARKALELEKSDADSWSLLARALYCLGKYREGIMAQQEAVKLDKEDMKKWDLLAKMWADSGHLREAEDALKKVLSMRPDYVDALERLIEIQKEIGYVEQAKISQYMLDEFLKANPNCTKNEDGFLVPSKKVVNSIKSKEPSIN